MPHIIDLYAEQVKLEKKYSKKRIPALILQDIAAEDDLAIWGITSDMANSISEHLYAQHSYESKSKRMDALIDYMDTSGLNPMGIALEIAVIVMSTPLKQTIQAICGRLGGFLGYEDVFHGVTTAAELLAVCEPHGLYELEAAAYSEEKSIMVIPRYLPEESVSDAIETTCYLPPMVHPPAQVSMGRSVGYLTESTSPILGSKNNIGQTLALDALNIANSTELRIDPFVLGLQEVPSNDKLDKKQQQQFEIFTAETKSICEELMGISDSFYMTHSFDERGRMYANGYHVNPMGNSYRKALVNLKKEVVLT